MEDNPLILEGIKRILNDKNAFEVVAETDTFDKLMQTPDCDPDIILLNQPLFESNTTEKMKDLMDHFQHAALALFISESQTIDIDRSLQNHVLGFLTLNMNVDSLVTALYTINENKYWLSPDMIQLVMTAYKENIVDANQQSFDSTSTPPPKHLISRREYEVLQCLSKGYSNKEISVALQINESTVKNHVANMLKKNNLKSRTPLLLKAIKNNWLAVVDEKTENKPEKTNE